jgi:hypothetical protein
MPTFCIAFNESYCIFLRYVYVPSGQNILPVLKQLKLSVGPGLISIVQILSVEAIFKDLEDRLENTLCAGSSWKQDLISCAIQKNIHKKGGPL